LQQCWKSFNILCCSFLEAEVIRAKDACSITDSDNARQVQEVVHAEYQTVVTVAEKTEILVNGCH
jgi:hypothetical protein